MKRACKRCGAEFDQPAIQGRPLEFCGYRCRLDAKREQRTRLANERYRALREAGVEPGIAQPASCSKHRFDALMQEASCRSD
jgi:hypothetical protein